MNITLQKVKRFIITECYLYNERQSHTLEIRLTDLYVCRDSCVGSRKILCKHFLLSRTAEYSQS